MIQWLGTARVFSQVGQVDFLANSISFIQALLNDILQQRGESPLLRGDGVVDLATCSRIEEYRTERNNFVSRGFADTFTIQQLDSLISGIEGQLRSFCSALETGEQEPPPPPEDFEDPFAECVIVPGVRSGAIETLQQQLNAQLVAQGFLPVPVTGVYDTQTCWAVLYVANVLGLGDEWIQIPQCPAGFFDVLISCSQPQIIPQRAGEAPPPQRGGGGGALAAIVAAIVLGGAYLVTQS